MKWVVQQLAQLTIWIVVAIALLLRLPLLGGSFWLDEAAQALESLRPLNQQLQISEDFQPPLLHLLLHFVAQISHTEWWLRLWGALIPGLVTIYCTYKIAEKLFSRQVAVIASVLLATSSFHILYSQELRPYSLSAALASVSWLILVKSLYDAKKLDTKSSIGYALTTALGLYSTYLYPFVITSQAGYIIWKERQILKQYLLSTVAAGILFLPWLPYLQEQLQVGQALRKSLPGWEAVVSFSQLKSIPLILGKFMFGILNIEISLIFLLSTLVFLGTVCWVIVIHFKKNREFLFSKQISVVLCWLIIPLVTSWLISFAIPVVQPKRVLYLMPAFYMFVAAVVIELQTQTIWQQIGSLFTRLVKRLKPKTPSFSIPLNTYPAIFAGTVGILLALNLFSTMQYYTKAKYQHENWRLIHKMITTNYPTDSAVIFAFDAAFAPWEWYDDGWYPVFATGQLTQASGAEVEEKLKKASQYSYLLVFDYLRDLTDPDRKIDAALENLGYSEKDVFGLPGIGFVRVFARQEDVLS